MAILMMHECKILHVLDADGGFAVKTIAEMVGPIYSSRPRSNSGQITYTLNSLRVRGYVDHLDDKKPFAWKRTENGTAALNRAIERGHFRPHDVAAVTG